MKPEEKNVGNENMCRKIKPMPELPAAAWPANEGRKMLGERSVSIVVLETTTHYILPVCYLLFIAIYFSVYMQNY